MREKPILFNTEMVRATDAGRKFQTRRMKGFEWINANLDGVMTPTLTTGKNDTLLACFRSILNPLTVFSAVECPFGNVGDKLWVRETYGFQFQGEDEDFPLSYPVYKAQEDECGQYPGKTKDGEFMHINYKGKWKPSIHMPKALARTWLQITNIRVERLQDISKEDAIAEGIEILDPWPECPEKSIYRLYNWEIYMGAPSTFDPIKSFYSLWCATYGNDAVIKNPFVWVVEYEKITKSEEVEAVKYINGRKQIDFGTFGMP